MFDIGIIQTGTTVSLVHHIFNAISQSYEPPDEASGR